MLLVYDRALSTGQGLVGPASQAERLRSFPGPAGYGIGFGCIDGWVGHTGELPGYNTSLDHDHLGVSLVSTSSTATASDAVMAPEASTMGEDVDTVTS